MLHKYLKRNKAAMNHKIYLWEFLLAMINISATSQMYSKIQSHTFLETEVSYILSAGGGVFQIHS